MTYYARINNGVVQEVRQFESIEGRFHPSITWVEADSTISAGDRYDSDTDTFSESPEAVVQIDSNNEVQAFREQPREKLEDSNKWIEASAPPTIEKMDGYRVVRFYDADTDTWTHEYRMTDPDNLRRNHAGESSKQMVRDALDNGNEARAIEQLAHIVTGDDRFDHE